MTFPDLHEPLSDGVVALRLFAERDIPDVLVAYQDDPELHQRLGEIRPPSGAELGRYAEEADARRVAGRGLTLTILESASDVCRGEIRVHQVDIDHARCELGIWLAPPLRGRGLAPRALRLAADWLIDTCGLERVAILTEVDNARMRSAAERAGFRSEGVLRGYALEHGRRIDHAVLSRVAGDL